MVAISSLEQGTLVGDRYRLVEPIDRFTPAAGGPSGAGFRYWLAFDETRGREVWLLFAEHRGRAATGADVAGAVSALRRLGHRAVPAVPDFGEIEFEVADAGADVDADADAEAGADVEPVADSVVESVGYAVLEPVDGESLSALLLRGALTEAEVFAVLRETAQLLRELHGAELVHGHLSVYSVLVADRGVRVVDLPAALALESAFDSGLTAAADVYAFCWLACLALVGVDGVEVELGAGYDAGSSPEDEAAAYLTADLLGRRRSWAEAALVDVYGLQADLAAWLVAGLGEASQRPTIDVVAEALYAVGPGAVAAGSAEAAGTVVADVTETAETAEIGAAEAQGEMIGIVAGATGYEVQVGLLPEAETGPALVEGAEGIEDVEEEEVVEGVEEAEEEASVVVAESVGSQDVAPVGAEFAGEQAAEYGAGQTAGRAAELAVAEGAAVAGLAAEAVRAQSESAQSESAQLSGARETPAAAEASQAAAALAARASAAAAAPAARRGGVGVARRPVATHSGSGRSGAGGPGSPSGPATSAAPVAFAAGAHRRPPRSAVLVAAGITALIIAGGAWALAEHHSGPTKPTAGASGSATTLAPSRSVPGAGAGSSGKASASASAPHVSPSPATGSPAAGGSAIPSGATPSTAPTTPTPGPLATVPAGSGQALAQIKQNITQAQALGQLPAAEQGPFNQAVNTLQQEISAGTSVQPGVSQLQSALNTPGLPAWFTSRLNQLIPYLWNRPGS